MFRLIVAAAALMAASAASARAPVELSKDGLSAHVSYADLDLRSTAGRAKMAVRIRLAAEMLCVDPYGGSPLSLNLRRSDCYREAIASGASQVDDIAGL